ncbi:MAG: hypothetical protein PHS32_03925 [Rhodoferax sp.]|uniref:hypothetical protein n=1 Tax=Rhodoferax sp. TaxID=50421 RepID=UPI002617B15D|nr:hypothetical protein [Rhodoferax sp.]MDD5332872.1 hypothetical protein [Rhodoferax sp.]
MRKTIFVFFILLGAAVGAFTALNEGIGLKLLSGGIGSLVGAIVGGAIAGIGRRHSRHPAHFDSDGLLDEQANNYWLDRGRLTAAPGLPQADDLDPFSHEP